jgi:cyclopropane-fatty-acyl-phospholipid synthase
MINEQLKKNALKAFENIEYGSLALSFPDGSHYVFQGKKTGANATLTLTDWRVLSALAFRGDIGFAEAYRDGWCDSPDLAALVQFSLENESASAKYLHGSFIGRLLAYLGNLTRLNTLTGSRKNIHAHYDLGNEFYRLWLDPSMTYSSALFSHPHESLLQAQYRKYDRILERLEKPTGSVLEIGCGWGGFADRALQHNDYALTGVTLSTEQKHYADHRLQGQANIVLEDYRAQQGKYDFLVSIEMFEAVGEQYWKTYFAKLADLMKQGGKAVVQTITIDHAHFPQYRKAGDFIRSFIFPGGMLPSPERFTQEANRAGLRVTDNFAFGRHYARTLQHWLDTFETRKTEVLALGFDEPFIRLWRLYLAACIASFTVGRTDVLQFELCHA